VPLLIAYVNRSIGTAGERPVWTLNIKWETKGKRQSTDWEMKQPWMHLRSAAYELVGYLSRGQCCSLAVYLTRYAFWLGQHETVDDVVFLPCLIGTHKAIYRRINSRHTHSLGRQFSEHWFYRSAARPKDRKRRRKGTSTSERWNIRQINFRIRRLDFTNGIEFLSPTFICNSNQNCLSDVENVAARRLMLAYH